MSTNDMNTIDVPLVMAEHVKVSVDVLYVGDAHPVAQEHTLG